MMIVISGFVYVDRIASNIVSQDVVHDGAAP